MSKTYRLDQLASAYEMLAGARVAGNSSSFLDDGSVGSPMAGSGAFADEALPVDQQTRGEPSLQSTQNGQRKQNGNVTTRITTDKQVPGFWRVTLNHPPINTVDDQMYDEIFTSSADRGRAVPQGCDLRRAHRIYFLAHWRVG